MQSRYYWYYIKKMLGLLILSTEVMIRQTQCVTVFVWVQVVKSS